MPSYIPPIEHYRKMRKLNELSDAIVRIRGQKKYTVEAIQQLQRLKDERSALRQTMGPLRLVRLFDNWSEDEPIRIRHRDERPPD